MAVVPMQDVLHLGSEARMNLPGTIGGNWAWRMKPGAATEDVARHLREMNQEYQRILILWNPHYQSTNIKERAT